MRKPGVFSYFSCSECGLVQQHPIPENLGYFYESYQVHAKKHRFHDLMRKCIMSRGYFLPRDLAGKRILDYGCGDGWYLQLASERGAICVGYEINAPQARSLRNRISAPVYSDAERLLDEHPGKFDAVTMHFVFEHLVEIDETMALVKRLLKKGGELHILVPNLDSFEFKVFRRKWHSLDPPRHTCFPNLQTFQRLSEKFGFSVSESRLITLPNDMAASLSNIFVGHYNYLFFQLAMPAALAWSLSTRGGNSIFLLTKN